MSPSRRSVASWLLRLVSVTLLVGIGAGLSGLLVSIALHAIEHLAYGYSTGTFLNGVVGAASWRRVSALGIAGVIGAVGWWALRRWAPRVVSVEEAVAGRRMPALVTSANAALQVVIVGLGASIGRELAPRELAAMAAGWVTDRAGVSTRERRILVACGAGAGLAAVYDVPLGGALFAVEVLLAELSLATAIPAIITSAIATFVGWVAVPQAPLYAVPTVQLTPSLVVWAVIAGPLIGLCAAGFVGAARFAERIRPSGWSILVIMPAVFGVVGLASVWLPAILGNGQALGQVVFDGALSILAVLVLMLAKVVATTATIGSGAAGGTLTPSVAIGVCLGVVLGGLWSLAWPGTSLAAFALVAAAAFLGTSMRAPLTAIVLVVEFSHQGLTLLAPTMLAVGGAVGIGYLLSRRRLAGVD